MPPLDLRVRVAPKKIPIFFISSQWLQTKFTELIMLKSKSIPRSKTSSELIAKCILSPSCYSHYYNLLKLSTTWANGTARRLQILRVGFDSRQESITFDVYTGWLLTRRAQAHLTISLNCCSIFSSIPF